MYFVFAHLMLQLIVFAKKTEPLEAPFFLFQN